MVAATSVAVQRGPWRSVGPIFDWSIIDSIRHTYTATQKFLELLQGTIKVLPQVLESRCPDFESDVMNDNTGDSQKARVQDSLTPVQGKSSFSHSA